MTRIPHTQSHSVLTLPIHPMASASTLNAAVCGHTIHFVSANCNCLSATPSLGIFLAGLFLRFSLLPLPQINSCPCHEAGPALMTHLLTLLEDWHMTLKDMTHLIKSQSPHPLALTDTTVPFIVQSTAHFKARWRRDGCFNMEDCHFKRQQ